MRPEQACPILPSRDWPVTKAFFARIGFEAWDEDDGYRLMNPDRVEIHFVLRPDHRPETGQHDAYIRLSNLDAVPADLSRLGLAETGIPRFSPAEDKPWGMREAMPIDPDGNLLRIGGAITDG